MHEPPRRRCAALVLAALALAARAVCAQPAPGSEFLVNVYTTNYQGIPAIAADGQGRFVVLWSSASQDGDGPGLFARRFDRLGTPRTGEIAVNTYTTGLQQVGSVASDAQGNFLATWERREPANPGGFVVVGRRFDRAGAALGPEFLLGSSSTLPQRTPHAGMQPDGRFLAAWTRSPGGIVARPFDAAGAPVGLEFAVSAASTNITLAHVSPAPDGGYLVTWRQLDTDGTSFNVNARRIAPSGLPAAPEFRVSSNSADADSGAWSSFRDDGGFIVVWDKVPPAGGQSSVFGRRFDPAGTPIGADFRLNSGTTTAPHNPLVATTRDGGFIVLWIDGGFDFDVYARRFDAAAAPVEPEFRVPMNNAYFQVTAAPARAPGDHMALAYFSDVADPDSGGVLARLLGVVPIALAVDTSPMQSNGNGVLEPGETVAVAPAWANADRMPLDLSGALSGFSGPGTGSYTITDPAASYGTVPLQQTASCTVTGDCYSVAVSTPPVRPAVHWDATVRERVAPRGDIDWPLHVGGSFADAAAGNPFYRFVETLLHHGVTAGCSSGFYCPAASASREQMAVFVLAAFEGAGYRPRDCQTPLFADVPASSPFCRFVEELARRGVVGGCGGGSYCPSSAVTREQMAVFVLRTREPGFTPPACTAPMFADVPASSPYCRWIEELARRGVVTGCGGGNYCPTAAVARDQMAVFIAGGFGLTLYGP
jgi:hypothetical protein